MRQPFVLLTLTVLLVSALAFTACGDDDDDDTGGGGATATQTAAGGSPTAAGGDTEPLELTITAEGFAFDVEDIEAAAGQEVNITLVNEDSAEHSFTIGSEDVTEAEGGEQAEGSFTASNDTTEFHCKYHPSMTGTITVN